MAPNSKEIIVILILLLVFYFQCSLSSDDGGPCKEQNLINKSFKLGFIIGYFVFALSSIIVFVSYCIPRTHLKEAKYVIVATPQMNRKKRADHFPATMQLLQIPMLERMVPSMSFAQLSEATYEFRTCNIIGFGEKGIMYQGILPNGSLVAVKRFKFNHQLIFNEEFIFELKTLGRFRHLNCVPLLGFCVESNENLLVYKYMSNGNLYDWLHPVQNESEMLEWPLKVKIAIGLARGLAWLHHTCSVRVAHLKLSSNCVLLDQNFEPKLSNFGKAMLQNPNDIGLNMPRGFSIDNQFWEWDFIKKDVFDFGILLLELITGEHPPTTQKTKGLLTGNVLGNWIIQFCSSPIQQGSHNNWNEMLHLIGVASKCVQPCPEKRPTMVEVYRTLRVVGDKYGLAEINCR